MLLAGCVALAEAASADSWLEITFPPLERSTTSLPLLEVKGHAGSRRGRGHDLIVALDLSDSTLSECGVDLDGDGDAGGTDPAFVNELRRRGLFPPRLAVRLEQGIDFDDTVLAAELEAAASLIERLDPRHFRIGLVVFSDDAAAAAPLGTAHPKLGSALEEIRFLAPSYLRGTNLAAAIAAAEAELVPPDAPPSSLRDRSLVVLTDGVPTLPLRGGPGPRAIEASVSAANQGIRIYPFAIGREARGAEALLATIASTTGGRASSVSHPSEVLGRLRELDLVDLAGVRIDNRTTGASARALRRFPDGSFDGFLRLAPGPNRIRVEATHVDGARHVAERLVVFDPSGVESPDRELLRARMDALRSRTRELEMWAEMEERRQRQRQIVEIEADGQPR